MRVLFDHQIYEMQKFGGISRYFNELKKLDEGKAQISSINPELFKPVTQDVKRSTKAEHDIIYRASKYLKRKIGLTIGKREVSNEQNSRYKFLDEVYKMLQKDSYDIFHPTYYDPYFLEFTNKPFVLTVHDMIHEIFKEFFSISDPTSHNKFLLCHQANQIITVSQRTKDDLLDLVDIPEEKVNVIPLASNFNKVQASKPLGIEYLKKYILYVGTRNQYKNFYFPIYALADLLKSDIQLQVLCTGHPFSKDEIKFFEDLGIQDQMIHIYPVNDNELSWLYRNAALFIFPSLYEGFGFPMLEAFATDCPVIASRGGSLPEVGGDAAIYFDPKNKKEIQDSAHAVLYDTALRNSLVKKGRLQFQKYSWEKCRAETLEVYRNVGKFV